MKKLIPLFLLLIAFTVVSFIPAFTVSQKPVSSAIPKIDVYYFHFTSRCTTCRTIEAQTKKNIEELYPALVKQGKVTFKSLNLDESSARPISEKLSVKAQTLLLVSGEQRINITNEGFRYAVGQPEKFKEIIKEKMEGLLK